MARIRDGSTQQLQKEASSFFVLEPFAFTFPEISVSDFAFIIDIPQANSSSKARLQGGISNLMRQTA
jgi:hypothetical protein